MAPAMKRPAKRKRIPEEFDMSLPRHTKESLWQGYIYIYNLWIGPNQVSQFLHHVGYNILWLPFWHPLFCMFIDHHCVGLILWKMIHLRFWNARCLNLQLPFLVPSRFQGAFSLGFYGGYDAVKKLYEGFTRDKKVLKMWWVDESFPIPNRYEIWKFQSHSCNLNDHECILSMNFIIALSQCVEAHA